MARGSRVCSQGNNVKNEGLRSGLRTVSRPDIVGSRRGHPSVGFCWAREAGPPEALPALLRRRGRRTSCQSLSPAAVPSLNGRSTLPAPERQERPEREGPLSAAPRDPNGPTPQDARAPSRQVAGRPATRPRSRVRRAVTTPPSPAAQSRPARGRAPASLRPTRSSRAGSARSGPAGRRAHAKVDARGRGSGARGGGRDVPDRPRVSCRLLRHRDVGGGAPQMTHR